MPDYSAGKAYLTVLPSLSGFGDEVRRQLAKEFGAPVEAPVKPTVGPEEEPGRKGEEWGGAFGDAARKRITAALSALPKPDLDANDDPAMAKIAELRTRLEELRDKRIGVDISGAEALAELRAIHSELDEVGRNHPDITVRANTSAAMAEVAALNAEVRDLDGKRASFTVSDNGSAAGAVGNINALMAAGIALGPAIIPVAAAVAAALAGIGTGAVIGASMLGTVKLATAGISGAVKALDTDQTTQGQNALQLHAQQISSANSVASAQDGVRNALRGVEDAERSAQLANDNAARAVITADRAVEDSKRQRSLAVQNALDAETQAEQTLQNALQSEEVAQQSLTLARQAAQRQIESLTLSVADGALAERQATLNITKAKQELDKVLANPASTQLQRDQAQLTYDQSVQQLTDIQARNRNLQQDKAAADKAGVDGSTQVQAAQRGVVSATQAAQNAQVALGKAQAAVTEARRAGDERVAVAQDNLRQAEAAQTETARAGAESVQKAKEGVTAAERTLTGALAQQAAQASQTSSAQSALAKAMKDLSPEQQEFARFIFSLKPELLDLQHTAAAGLLPGVEQGIKAVLPLLPDLRGLVGDVATEMGNMAAKTGAALDSPFWRNWILFIRQEAAPSVHTFLDVLGNLATGGAAVLQAFRPVWDEMGAGIDGWSKRFATAAQNLQANPQFQNFLDYVKTEGPVVMDVIGTLGSDLILLGQDLAPLGGLTLSLVDGVLHLVQWVEKANPGLVSFAGGMISVGLGVSKLAPMLSGAALSGGVFLEKMGLSAAASTSFASAGEKASGALGKLGSALPVVGIALIALDAIWTSAVTSTDDAAAAFLRGGQAAATMRAKLDDELTGFGQWANSYLHFAATSDDATAAMNKQLAAMDPLTRAQTLATKAQNDYLAALARGPAGAADATAAQAEYGRQTAEVTRQQDLLRNGLDAATNSLQRQQEMVLGAVDADIRYEDALSRTRDAIKQNGAATDIHTAAGRANMQAFLDLIRATQADEDEMRKNGVSIDELNAKHQAHISELQGVASQLGLTGAEADRYIGTLGRVPKSIDTAFLANTIPAVAQVNQMAIDIGNAVRGIQDETVTISFVGKPPNDTGNILAKATGGAIEGPGTGTSDSILARLSAGEHVWTAAEVAGAGGHTAVTGLRALAMQKQLPAYATGGPVDYQQSETFGSSGIPEMIGLEVGLIRNAAAKMKAQAAQAEMAPSSSPGVAHWRPISLQALAIAGESAANLGKLEMQMGTESGGNPTAINRWDSNWTAGHPSVGLMQVIRGTYAAYKDPRYDVGPYEYGVSEDPLSNILAAIRYTRAAYGSLAAGWQGHGYDSGGILPPGMTMAYNGTGAPEHVLTGRQFDDLASAVGAGGGGVQVNVYPRAEHSEADIADMVSARLSLAMRTQA